MSGGGGDGSQHPLQESTVVRKPSHAIDLQDLEPTDQKIAMGGQTRFRCFLLGWKTTALPVCTGSKLSPDFVTDISVV